VAIFATSIPLSADFIPPYLHEINFRPDWWDYHAYFDQNIILINIHCDGMTKHKLNEVKKHTTYIKLEARTYLSNHGDYEEAKKFHKLDYGFDETIKKLKNDGVSLSAAEIAFMYDFLYGPIRKGFDPEGISEEEELKLVPLKVRFGVTICLCGFFLHVLPDVRLKETGKNLMAFGGALAFEGMVSKLEQDEK
jgi:hypothetical protein